MSSKPLSVETFPRCAGDQVFWERRHDCSMVVFIFFLENAAPLMLHVFFSRDYTADIDLNRAPIDNIELRTMSTSANGTTDTLNMSPFAEYTLNLLWIVCLLISMFVVTVASSLHVHVYAIKNLTRYFLIKFNMKIPKYITHVRVKLPVHSSVTMWIASSLFHMQWNSSVASFECFHLFLLSSFWLKWCVSRSLRYS
jgi:hypothetical protein